MPYTVIVHVAGEEAVVGELAELPGPADTSVLVNRVRRRDGKPVHYLAPGVTTVIWPMDRLTFIEMVPERPARVEEVREARPAPAATAAPPVPEPEPVVEPEPAPEPAPARAGLLSQRRANQAAGGRSGTNTP